MSAQYDPVVQAVLFGYANVFQHDDGKWVAELLPEMLNPFVLQKLPPGQCVYAGSTGLVSEYAVELVPEKTSEGWRTLHDLELWASVPHFHSFETAQAMIMHWLNNERPDLVSESQNEVREGRIYRANQAKRPPQYKAPPTMWDQLLS